MSRTAEIRRVAANVYDQDAHSPADLAFLDAIAQVNKECSAALARSNMQWGPLSDTHQIVKRLAEKRREDGYCHALAQFEAAKETGEIEFQQAAE